MVSPVNFSFTCKTLSSVQTFQYAAFGFKKHATARRFLLTGCKSYGAARRADLSRASPVGNVLHVFSP